MERVLKWLGYKEKATDVDRALQDAKTITRDSRERMNRIRATLNGEDKWFLGGDCFGRGEDDRR